MESDMPTPSPPLANLLDVKPSVRTAYRKILRYIHIHNLGPNDKLPTQQTLRKQLSLGNDTLDLAMQILVSDGVVRRQQKTGTLVCNPRGSSLGIWTVGLTRYDHGDSGYAGIQDFYIRKLLAQNGCENRVFFRTTPACDRPHQLSDFHGLTEAVEANQLDIILSTEHLVTHRIQVFHFGDAPDITFGLLPDMPRFICEAIEQLLSADCYKIALVGSPSDYLSRFQYQKIEDAIEAMGNPALSVEYLPLEGSAMNAGDFVAQQLLKRPADQRPDGVILTDDYITMGLTYRLRQDGDYRPTIVSRVNRQMPLVFSCPVIQFEIDIEAYARHATKMVIDWLLNPTLPLQIEHYQDHQVSVPSS